MRHLSFLLAISLAAFALGSCDTNTAPAPDQTPASERPTSEQQLLVDKAQTTVEELRSDRVVGRAVNDALKTARGVLVFPNLVRAGFVIGGGGGTGTLLARTAAGWSDPAFYFSGEASFGLQIGAEAGRVIFIIRNDGALLKIVNGNVNLGADVSIAAGPVGVGAAAAATPNLDADLLAYSVQVGLFGGAGIRGGVIAPRQDWNEVYYGPGATPRAIAIEERFHNPGALGLKNALAP
jgi:lipid-binding SYLF domain-containing protein